jgi:hypothetical protein
MHGDVGHVAMEDLEDSEGSTQTKQGQATHVGALVVPVNNKKSNKSNMALASMLQEVKPSLKLPSPCF